MLLNCTPNFYKEDAMVDYLQLEESIKQHIEKLFRECLHNHLTYHNYEHTQKVVSYAKEIAGNYSLTPAELFVLYAAAWFHDTGHLIGDFMKHEDRSVELMKRFFTVHDLHDNITDSIENCICATKFPHKPKSLLEEIICDADTYNLGTEDFLRTDELLKKELLLRKNPVVNWEENTLELLLTHRYFTTYCQNKLDKGKEENIQLMRYLLQEK